MNLGDDPQKWSVDEVVHALCYATETWMPYMPTYRRKLPDLKNLEKVLRALDIDGFALQHVDHSTIRDEFGLTTFPQRVTILQAIDKVRRWPTLQLEPPEADEDDDTAPQLVKKRRIAPTLIAQTFKNDLEAKQTKKRRVAPTIVTATKDEVSIDHSSLPFTPEDVIFGNVKRGSEINLDVAIPEEGQEFQFLGIGDDFSIANSKVTYKTLLRVFGVLPDDTNHSEGPQRDTSGPVGYTVPFDLSTRKRGKKKKDRATLPGYPVVQIDPIVLTRRERDLIATRGFPTSLPPGLDDVLSPAPYKRLGSAWRGVHGGQRSALFSHGVLADGPDEDEVMDDSRNDIEGEDELYASDFNVEDKDDLDASDVDVEEGDPTDDEATDETLTHSAIVKIMDDAIAEFVKEWETTIRPRYEDNKALALWKLAQGRSGRQILIEHIQSSGSRYSVSHLDSYLAKLRANLLDEDMHKSAIAFKRQCMAMQPTVYNRQEALWKIDVLKRPQPPQPTKKPGQKAPAVKPSDSTRRKSRVKVDEMADFIVDDEDDSDICSVPSSNASGPGSPMRALPLSRPYSHPPGAMASPTALTAMGIPGFASATLAISTSHSPGLIADTNVKAGSAPRPNQEPTARARSTGPTVVSLSSDRESSLPLRGKSESASATPEPHSALPSVGFHSDQDVLDWDWEKLEQERRRGHLMEKMVRTMTTLPIFNTLKSLVNRRGKQHRSRFWDGIGRGLNAMLHGENLQGNSEAESNAFIFGARLMVACDQHNHRYIMPNAPALEDRTRRALFAAIGHPEVDRGLAKAFLSSLMDSLSRKLIIQPGEERVRGFTDTPSDEEPDQEAEDETIRLDNIAANGAPLNVRQEMKNKVVTAQERMRKSYQAFRRSPSASNRSWVQVNSPDCPPPLFIDRLTSARMLVHQIGGVRFMWREVVEGASGCLLAHTMGLGKTMQAITLLTMIASALSAPRTCTLLPEGLKFKFHAVVVCPPALIENWMEEFSKWAPHVVLPYPVYKLDRTVPDVFRAQIADDWVSTQGTIVIGYQLLSLDGGRTKATKTILSTATIVIADEAHTIKNAQSNMRAVMGQFRTKHRVALTGTPLSNNLQEYYSLVHWVEEGYLGTNKEFTNTFEKRITNGLYKDSGRVARRLALKLLEVLKRTIAPKVQFLEMSFVMSQSRALSGPVLPPKVELLVHVALTDVQKRMYKVYVDWYFCQDRPAKGQTLSIFLGVGDLGLICCQPSLLLDAVAERIRSNGGNDADSDDPASGISDRKTLQGQLMKAVGDVEDAADPRLSHQMVLFLQIVDYTIQANEKLLVYSGSIYVLDYVQFLLEQRNIEFRRVDGSVASHHRQSLSAQFNEGSIPVFIISDAGGTGFNLPAASRVVIFGLKFNPSAEEQAVGRAYRLGQDKPVFVYRFIAAGSAQQKIKDVQYHKKQLAIRTLENRNLKSAADRPSNYISSLKDIAFRSLTSYQGKDPKVLDKILTLESAGKEPGRHSFITEIETTETFRVEDDDKLTPEELKEIAEMQKSPELLRRAVSQFSINNEQSAAQAGAGSHVNSATQPAANPAYPGGSYTQQQVAHPPYQGDQFVRQQHYATQPGASQPQPAQAFHAEAQFPQHGVPTSRVTPNGPQFAQQHVRSAQGGLPPSGKFSCPMPIGGRSAQHPASPAQNGPPQRNSNAAMLADQVNGPRSGPPTQSEILLFHMGSSINACPSVDEIRQVVQKGGLTCRDVMVAFRGRCDRNRYTDFWRRLGYVAVIGPRLVLYPRQHGSPSNDDAGSAQQPDLHAQQGAVSAEQTRIPGPHSGGNGNPSAA